MTYRKTSTWPVSGSIATRATWQPLAIVSGRAGSNFSRTSRPASGITSVAGMRRAGAPRTVITPSSSIRSSAAASSTSPARSSTCLRMASAAFDVALPGSGALGAQFLERELEEARVIAAVVDVSTAAHRKSGRVRDLIRLDEVAPPQGRGIEPERTREAIHHALDPEVSQRTSATADEAGGNRVGIDEV